MGTEIYRNDGDNIEKKFLSIWQHGTSVTGEVEYSITVRTETITIPAQEMRDIASKLAVFFIERR